MDFGAVLRTVSAFIRFLLQLPVSTAVRSGAILNGTAWASATMTSRRPSELLNDEDLPTTRQDVEALRQRGPRAGSDWLEDLAALAAPAPHAARTLRERRTFAGLPPFEL